jgi:D-inositol-3-phosphate glycosyltransferase
MRNPCHRLRRGRIKYSVADGETGFLVPPKDPDALASRLAEIFKDPDLLKRFSKQAVQRVMKYFTWETVGCQIAEVYEEVIHQTMPETTGCGKPAGTNH